MAKRSSIINPILSEKTMLTRRQAIEDRFALELPKLLKNTQSKQAIRRVVADNCWGLWLYGIKEGADHARRELEILGFKRAKFSLVEEAPDGVIQNRQAETAVRRRNNALAGNVADTEWARIQNYLTTNIRGEASREQLVGAISEVLGGDRFRARARTIARTELAFAYNGGRIQTYRENGVEAVRRYCITDERTCPVCLGLNNAMARLDDWISMQRINAPSHPNCRCVLSPVIDLDELANFPKPPPLGSKQWLVESILKAVAN